MASPVKNFVCATRGTALRCRQFQPLNRIAAPASHLIFRIRDLPRPRKAGVRFSKGGIACILVPCRASRKQNSLPDSPLTVSAVLRDDDKFRRGAGMDLGITGRVAIVAAASKG